MESIQIKDHMNHRPVYFSGKETVVEAVEKLLQSRSSGGPVINEQREVIGFVSEQDCLKAMISSSYHSGESSKSVADVMKVDVLTKKPYDSVLQLAEEMVSIKPRVYPVVDDDGILLGCVNRSEVLRALDMHLHSLYQAGHRYV
ncbi:MAG: CBS domain-containing protein [Gammaproteobacteria bacterium]|nr:CBS domain-containing protein [Gammaproteobacteria bacterium]